MAESNPYMKIEGSNKGPIIFGRDVSEIPCFRSSWLYGISTGIFGGLMTFMATSRPQLATKYGFIYLIGTTTGYWIYCRYNWMKEVKAAQELQKVLKSYNSGDPILIEPPKQPSSQPDLEIVTVNNKV